MARQIWQKRVRSLMRRLPLLVAISFRIWRIFQPKVTLGAVGILFDGEGRVLLVEHALHPKTPWGLPGGWVDRGEEPAEAVCRELREELSIHATVTQVILTGSPFPNHLDIAFLCHTDDPIGTLSYELIDYAWFKVEDIPRLLSFHYQAIHQAISLLQDTPHDRN